jgi:hypothetical protein
MRESERENISQLIETKLERLDVIVDIYYTKAAIMCYIQYSGHRVVQENKCTWRYRPSATLFLFTCPLCV